MQQAADQLLSADYPVILDAGAITKRTYPKRKAPVILTPHPGEFSRMTGLPIQEIQQNRAGYAAEWAERLHATIVLKGNETIIAFPDGNAAEIQPETARLQKGTGDTLTE